VLPPQSRNVARRNNVKLLWLSPAISIHPPVY